MLRAAQKPVLEAGCTLVLDRDPSLFQDKPPPTCSPCLGLGILTPGMPIWPLAALLTRLTLPVKKNGAWMSNLFRNVPSLTSLEVSPFSISFGFCVGCWPCPERSPAEPEGRSA